MPGDEAGRLLTLNGATLWIAEQGHGLPVVLISGGLGCCDYLEPVATLIRLHGSHDSLQPARLLVPHATLRSGCSAHDADASSGRQRGYPPELGRQQVAYMKPNTRLERPEGAGR